MKKILCIILALLPSILQAAACPQTTPVVVNKALVMQIAGLSRGSHNAADVQRLLGPACACVPLSTTPADTWMCQWKGDLSSNRLINTLNITFEAGMVAQVVGVDKDGDFMHKP